MSNNYLTYSKSLLFKENRPVSLVYFITEKCNLKCGHCFLSEEAGSQVKELNLKEIDVFSKSIGKLLSLSLTGGEPFLRKDIVEIAQCFYRNNQIRNLNIPTNGILTDTVATSIKEILSTCPGLALNLGISLDGFAECHDKTRNYQGAFSSALKTFKSAMDLKRSFPNLSVEILTVLTASNQNSLASFYDFVIHDLKPDSLNFVPVRGEIRDASLKDFDLGVYQKIIKRLRKAFLSQEITGYKHMRFSEYVLAQRLIALELVLRTLKENRFQTPCFAGSLSGIVYANGDVAPCELLDRKIGNLRDFQFDFMKLWESDEARDIRRHIRKSRCFCIHPCSMTMNILFNPKHLFSLAAYGLWLKAARLFKKVR
jgi:MoaA/NifB/PqqE/SkfB family radical SAM enzyme